jgi:hypothetical protein
MSDTMNIDGVQLLPRSCCPVTSRSIYDNVDINRPLYDWEPIPECSSFSGTDDKREILESLQDELVRLRAFLTANSQICSDYLWMMFGDRPDDVDRLAYMYPSNIIVVPPFKLPMNFYTFIRTPGCFNHLFFHVNDFWMRRLGSSLMGPVTVTMYPRSGWVFLRSKYELGERYNEFVEQMETFRLRLATLPRFVLESVSSRECSPMIVVQEVRHRKRYGPRYEFRFPSVRAVLAMIEFLNHLAERYVYITKEISFMSLAALTAEVKPNTRLIGGFAHGEEISDSRNYTHVFDAVPLNLGWKRITRVRSEAQKAFEEMKTHPDYTLISATEHKIGTQRALLNETCDLFKTMMVSKVGSRTSREYRTDFSTRGLQFFVRGLNGLPFDKQLNEFYLIEMYQIYSFMMCTDLRLGRTLNWLLISQYLTKLSDPGATVSSILELGFADTVQEVIADLQLVKQLIDTTS